MKDKKDEIALLKKGARNKSNKCKNIQNKNKLIKKSFKKQNSNPKNIKSLFLTILDSSLGIGQDDCFCVFKSIDDILCLIYKKNNNCNNSIVIYNLIDKKIIIEIKNPHPYSIGRFKYFYDDLNKRDLLLSYYDHNIKLWNINTLENLFNLDLFGRISSACFLYDNNNINKSRKYSNSNI